MKFTKYNLIFLGFLSLFSCDYASELMEDNQEIKMYQCDTQVQINSITKGINPCTYLIKYTENGYMTKKGRFELTMKNDRNSYTKNSKEFNLETGTNEVLITIDQCQFSDQITKSCFSVYK